MCCIWAPSSKQIKKTEVLNPKLSLEISSCAGMLLTSGQGWGHWWSEGGCEHPWGRTTGRGQAGGTGTHGLLLRWKDTAQSKKLSLCSSTCNTICKGKSSISVKYTWKFIHSIGGVWTHKEAFRQWQIVFSYVQNRPELQIPLANVIPTWY